MSAAARFIRNVQTTRYAVIAAFTILVYDHCEHFMLLFLPCLRS
jgi:hypothetical protein